MCQPGRPRPQGLSQPGCSADGRLPQHEIGAVALVRRDLHPSPLDHLRARAPRQRAVGGERRHVEQHVPFGLVSMAPGEQPQDHRDHLGHVPGRVRLDRRRQHVQRRHVLVVGGGIALRDHLGRDPLGLGGSHDPVVDVGDVAYVDHVAVAPLEQPEQHVEYHGRSGIADVRVIVHGGPAHIHGRPTGIGRGEHLLAPGQRIVELHRCAFRWRPSLALPMPRLNRQRAPPRPAHGGNSMPRGRFFSGAPPCRPP